MDKNDSYVFGILITDGNLYLDTRNRGRVQLEISKRDEDLVDKLVSLIPFSKKSNRIRITNFSVKETSYVSFKNFKREFRENLIENGFPIKNKTENASTPLKKYDEAAFWRGVIDGDGSIGVTSKNEPFVSLVTKSEFLKEKYLEFLYKNFNITKNLNRNKRDNIYNIIVKNKDAVNLAKLLYDNNDIHLNRKYEKAMFILKNFQY